jgi:hypothetical protein
VLALQLIVKIPKSRAFLRPNPSAAVLTAPPASSHLTPPSLPRPPCGGATLHQGASPRAVLSPLECLLCYCRRRSVTGQSPCGMTGVAALLANRPSRGGSGPCRPVREAVQRAAAARELWRRGKKATVVWAGCDLGPMGLGRSSCMHLHAQPIVGFS